MLPISVDLVEFARTPARGLMRISQDNPKGPSEAQVLTLNVESPRAPPSSAAAKLTVRRLVRTR